MLVLQRCCTSRILRITLVQNRVVFSEYVYICGATGLPCTNRKSCQRRGHQQQISMCEKDHYCIRLDAEEFIAPDTISVYTYDIGITFRNGLGNAIVACQKLRQTELEADIYISIRSFRKGKMYFMQCFTP